MRAWLAERLPAAAATAAACAFAASPLVLAQSGTLMPEAAYLLVFCALLLPRAKNAAGPLLLALTQLRPAGVSALPAVLARPLAERKWKRAAARAAWPLLGALAWALWCRARGGAVQEAAEWRWTFSGAEGPLSVALGNAAYYARTLGSTFLPAAWGASAAATLAGALAFGAAGWGAARALREDRLSPEAWALAGAAVMHLFWGWRYERYFLPVLPLVLWGAGRALGKRSVPAFAAAAALALVFHGPAALKAGALSKPEAAGAYAWLENNTRPEDAFASLAYARDGYYAGRPAAPIPAAADPAGLSDALKKRRIRWVLWQSGLDLGLSGRTAVNATLARAGENLEDKKLFRKRFDDGAAAVYEAR